MSATPSITVNEVIVALTNFLQPIMPDGTQIVRGQANRVSMPNPPLIVLTEAGQVRLSTTKNKWLPDDKADYQRSIQINVQVDFYDGQAGEMCSATETLFRSLYGAENFPPEVRPLYCSDGTQSPLITGEEQYESRWTLTASMQYNPVVNVAAEQFDVVGETSVIAADLITP